MKHIQANQQDINATKSSSSETRTMISTRSLQDNEHNGQN